MIRRSRVKLPPLTSDFVHRPRLGARLGASVSASAIILEAPDGYGKRTLLRHWLDTRDEPHAWLSVGRDDAEFRPFAEHLVRAIRTAVPGACSATQALLKDENERSNAEIVRSLLDEIELLEDRVILVLEGIEEDADREVYALLDQLLEHPLDSLCLVLSTRGTLPLRLSQLRARSQLAEFGIADLAFSGPETEALIEKIGHVRPSEEALRSLETKVEGWAAGLRFIAASLSDESDPIAYLESFDATPRVIELYLEDEVLRYECACMRERLYRSAILDRFSYPLWEFLFGPNLCTCDPGRRASQTTRTDSIEPRLAASHFTLPVAGREGWYRYHPMFRGLLRQHLERRCDTEEIARIHERASEWFESEGLISEAVSHALSAGDRTRAAEMVERRAASLLNADDLGELELWLAQLPLDLRRSRYDLLMVEAALAYRRFEMWKIRPLLRAADDLERGTRNSIEQTFLTAVLELWGSNIEESIGHFSEVIESDAEDYDWLQLDAYFYRGMALHVLGRGEEARNLVDTALLNSPDDQSLKWVRLYSTMTYLRIVRGELVLDDPAAEGLLGCPNPFAVDWGHYLLGVSALRSFELDRARYHLRHVSPGFLGFDAMAGIATAFSLQGRDEEARECLVQSWQTASENALAAEIGVLSSCEARLALIRGDLEQARNWQRSYERKAQAWESRVNVEVPDITELRILASSDDLEDLKDANARIDELWDGYDAIHFECQKYELAPIRALLLMRVDEHEKAVAAMRAAVEMSAASKWIRPFVELGAPILDLLDALPEDLPERAFVEQLQAIIREGRATPHPSLRVVRRRSTEPALTNREVDVLELLAARLRDKEIAERLGVSHQTVKTHLKHVYRKLDCRNRRDAVAAARRLNLLPLEFPPNPPPDSP